jgi:hypothetical protein
MNENDIKFIKSLTNPKTPFLDIVRAIYRAQRLLCQEARDVLEAELQNIAQVFNIKRELHPDNICLSADPTPDSREDWWDYESCSCGAGMWLPEPVNASLWLFVAFRDEGSYVGVGLEFPKKSDRNRWKENLSSDFIEEQWEKWALVKKDDVSSLDSLSIDLTAILNSLLDSVSKANHE